MSGSIGNFTYSHNRGGQIVKNRRTPVNPNSTKQQAVRSNFSTLSGAWSLLSATNQSLWQQWASLNPIIDSLGQSIVVSGQNAYIMLNSRLLQAGASAQSSPPAGTGPAQLVTCTAAWVSPFAVTITFTTTPLAAGLRLQVSSTLPGTKGRNGNRNQARVLGYTSAAASSPAAITSPYAAIAAQAANIYVSVMDAAGRISPPLKVPVVTT
jgi:hypothetical protein